MGSRRDRGWSIVVLMALMGVVACGRDSGKPAAEPSAPPSPTRSYSAAELAAPPDLGLPTPAAVEDFPADVVARVLNLFRDFVQASHFDAATVLNGADPTSPYVVTDLVRQMRERPLMALNFLVRFQPARFEYFRPVEVRHSTFALAVDDEGYLKITWRGLMHYFLRDRSDGRLWEVGFDRTLGLTAEYNDKTDVFKFWKYSSQHHYGPGPDDQSSCRAYAGGYFNLPEDVRVPEADFDSRRLSPSPSASPFPSASATPNCLRVTAVPSPGSSS